MSGAHNAGHMRAGMTVHIVGKAAAELRRLKPQAGPACCVEQSYRP